MSISNFRFQVTVLRNRVLAVVAMLLLLLAMFGAVFAPVSTSNGQVSVGASKVYAEELDGGHPHPDPDKRPTPGTE